MSAAVFHGTRAELRALLGRLPRTLAGRAPDPLGLAGRLQRRLGVALLEKVRDAFLVKSRGGTGDDGIKWAPRKAGSRAGHPDLCRASDRYFRSLDPGAGGRPSGEPEQVFLTPPGRVVVGTAVPCAGYQHRLRPLWPAGGKLPAAWWRHLLRAAAAGAARAVSRLVRGGMP